MYGVVNFDKNNFSRVCIVWEGKGFNGMSLREYGRRRNWINNYLRSLVLLGNIEMEE